MVDNEPAPSETRPPTAILADIAAGLSTGRDLPELLRQFLAPVMRLAGAQGGAVRVLSASGERLDLVSAIGLSSEMCRQERSVDRHCGFCGAAADGSPVVWAPDLSDCHTRHGATLGAGTAAQRMLAVPLQHRGRVLGVYNLFFTGGGEPGPTCRHC